MQYISKKKDQLYNCQIKKSKKGKNKINRCFYYYYYLFNNSIPFKSTLDRDLILYL